MNDFSENLCLCFTIERKSSGTAIGRVNDERIVFFGWCISSPSKSLLNGLMIMCLLTALCRGSSEGQWEDFYRADLLHWEKSLWGDSADKRSRKGCSESSWRILEAIRAEDCWSEEERSWARAAFTCWGHLLPPGNKSSGKRDSAL